MKGIRYLVDNDGQKVAVVIDLKKHGELWEDIYDALTAAQRRDEPRHTLDAVRKRLERTGKLKRLNVRDTRKAQPRGNSSSACFQE